LKAPLKFALLGAGGLAIAALVVTGADRVVERERTKAGINRLRDELQRARISADRCQGTLQTSEASLLDLGITIDSLRSLVDSFETMNGRGVPGERYPEYLEIFDSYNDSVASWEDREQRLRISETSCRETIQGHNLLTDSLQSALNEAGIVPG
jgi:hypothetical protein